MHLVQELAGLTIKRSKTGYIAGQGASVMLVEADNGNVSETMRYNQHVWKGMIFMGQETSYVGPLLFEQLYKSVIPFTVGQTLPTGGSLTPKLAMEMYDNPYLQQHPPETIERDCVESTEEMVNIIVTPNRTGRKRAASTTSTGTTKKPRTTKTLGCTAKEMRELKARANAKSSDKNEKEIFIRGYLNYNGEKLTDKSALIDKRIQTSDDEHENPIGEYMIHSTPITDIEYERAHAEARLEEERINYEEGIQDIINQSIMFDML